VGGFCNSNKHADFESRNQIIIKAFNLYAYTQSELADHRGLQETAISKILNKTT
jgi:hypothetical protein